MTLGPSHFPFPETQAPSIAHLLWWGWDGKLALTIHKAVLNEGCCLSQHQQQ